MTAATIGTIVAFSLTLMVYCYLAKDIPLLRAIYRVAAYLLIGVTLGYAAIVAWHSVLSPRLLLRLESGQWWYLVPLGLCLLLLTKAKRSWSGAGNIPLAFVFGVGAALAVGGALAGTLIPQTQAAFVSLNPAHYEGLTARDGGLSLIFVTNAALVTLGTVCTLLAFSYTVGTGAQDGGPGRRLLDGIIQVACFQVAELNGECSKWHFTPQSAPAMELSSLWTEGAAGAACTRHTVLRASAHALRRYCPLRCVSTAMKASASSEYR